MIFFILKIGGLTRCLNLSFLVMLDISKKKAFLKEYEQEVRVIFVCYKFLKLCYLVYSKLQEPMDTDVLGTRNTEIKFKTCH